MLKRFQKSNNPVMKKGFASKEYASDVILDAPEMAVADKMTINGTIGKSILLTLIVIASGAVTFQYFPIPAMWYIGMFGAMGLAFFIGFNPKRAVYLAPIYAVLEGLFLGAFSYQYSYLVEGIVFKAVGLTVLTLFSMLMVYRSGLIPVTKKFRMAIVSITMGIFLMYVVSFIMSFFFGIPAAYLHDGGWLSIGLSAFILVIAALNLLLDFDMIDNGVKAGAPKYMEWYGAFGLLVTLVWIYFEFVRLLALLASGD